MTTKPCDELQGTCEAYPACICGNAWRNKPAPSVAGGAGLPEPEWLKRCDWCGWTLVEEGGHGCWPSNCSMRPLPKEPPDFALKRYAREQRAAAESLRARVEILEPWQTQALQMLSSVRESYAPGDVKDTQGPAAITRLRLRAESAEQRATEAERRARVLAKAVMDAVGRIPITLDCWHCEHEAAIELAREIGGGEV